MVARHQILRTTFDRSGSVPLQVVTEPGGLVWSETGPIGDRELDDLLGAERRAPFDLAAGPVLHACLAPMAGGGQALVLTLPALCADSRSLHNLAREVAALCGGAGADGGDEPVQYAKYAEWQNGMLLEEDAREGRDYWSGFTAESSRALALPFVTSPEPAGVFAPRTAPVELAIGTAARIEELARGAGTSAGEVLLAVWQALLRRLTGQAELTIGCACDGRDYEILASAVGPMSRYLPLRTDVDPAMGLAELARVVQGRLAEAREWQEYCDMEPGCFAALFDFEEPASADGLVLAGYCCSEPFLVRLAATRHRGELAIDLAYDPVRWDEPSARRLAESFSRLLAEALEMPRAPIGELAVVGEGERRELVQGPQTGGRWTGAGCMHELFAEQARLGPERIAVACGESEITYRELHERSNRLARRLRRLGAGPGARIALLLDRSVEMVTAILGVLKAGAAYVPIDPVLPPERVGSLLAGARPMAVVSRRSLASGLTGSTPSLLVDAGDETNESDADLPPVADGNDLAYVLFTSGSTGTPKGVEVEHRQIANYVRAISAVLDLPPGSGFAMVSTFAADLGNTVLFPALCGGGRLYVATEERASDAERLAADFDRFGVDCLKVVPSHLSALLGTAHPERLLPRRVLVLGGEALSWELAERIGTLAPRCRILNHYGPTETTVGVLTFPIERGRRSSFAAGVPLGRPLANVQVHVVDSALLPVPTGVPGEIYVGGANVARGYLAAADLTAERFVPDPFGDEAGARLYRTGDRARRLPDGTLEFLGRADQQVKIRGFRVEPGEVEAAIKSHPGIQDAVVVAREDGGALGLVAYIVPEESQPAAAEELREFLRCRLPEAMVPARYISLRAFPLTRNGKIDRVALPAPDMTPERAQSTVAPRNRQEHLLAAIWREVLGVSEVGIEDNFFGLGGDSILAIQVVARANRQGLRLATRDLFRHQTIADLAAVAGDGQRNPAASGPVSGPVPLTPIQHWFFAQDLPDPQHFNQAVMLEVRQGLEAKHLATAFAALLEHHDALRLRCFREGGRWRQEIAQEDGEVPFQVFDLSAAGEPAATATMTSLAREIQASLDLRSGPLVRAALFDFGPGRAGRLLVVIHHLAIDGVSWRIVLEDLERVLADLRRGGLLELPERTTSFQQWAELLTEAACDGRFEGDRAYWLAQPSDLPPLPVDHRQGENIVAAARIVEVALDAGETATLLKEATRTLHARVDEVLVTALALACRAWTGSDMLRVDLEGHGREEIGGDLDLSRTVGWFTTHFPVFVDLSATTGAGAALKRVGEQMRMIPNHGFAHGLLLHLGEDEELAARPRPEIKLNYLGQVDQVLTSELLGPAPEDPGPMRSLQGRRSHLFEVDAMVRGHCLRITWTYSSNLHRAETVEGLAWGFAAALRSIAAQCLSGPADGSYAASDFPLAQLGQDELEAALREAEFAK